MCRLVGRRAFGGTVCYDRQGQRYKEVWLVWWIGRLGGSIFPSRKVGVVAERFIVERCLTQALQKLKASRGLPVSFYKARHAMGGWRPEKIDTDMDLTLQESKTHARASEEACARACKRT